MSPSYPNAMTVGKLIMSSRFLFFLSTMGVHCSDLFESPFMVEITTMALAR